MPTDNSGSPRTEQGEAILRDQFERQLQWLRERAPWLADYEPSNVLEIHVAGRHFVLAELTDDGSSCASGRDHSRHSFVGTTEDVIAAVAGLPVDDPWVRATTRALVRERGWKGSGSGGGRRNELEVKLGHGDMFHVSACANRASIDEHGLDWSRMTTAPGVAGSTKPELPGIFLQEFADDDFFVQMARTATDMWRVDVEGLWLESGPSGWWLVSEPIDRRRLQLLPPLYGAEDPLPY